MTNGYGTVNNDVKCPLTVTIVPIVLTVPTILTILRFSCLPTSDEEEPGDVDYPNPSIDCLCGRTGGYIIYDGRDTCIILSMTGGIPVF